MKPNIFDLATKELSQDAFIAWLLQYGDDRQTECFSPDDFRINKCAKEFINELLKKADPNINSPITKVNAGRQWKNIDVWAEIDDKYLIIIEDKTNTGQSLDQLPRYKLIGENWCKSQQPAYDEPICIYLKTGNESLSSLKKVTSQGYFLYNRQHFLDLLNSHNEIENQILKDFRDRLRRLEDTNQRFERIAIKHWDSNDWVGFYQFLDIELGLTGWSYVPNPSGGFWCAVIDWPFWNGFPVHYQIEQGKLCFKICFDPGETDWGDEVVNKNAEQDKWQAILVRSAKEQIPELRRPHPYVHRGTNRTVMVIDQNKWIGNPDEKIDKAAVVERLRKYKAFVQALIKSSDIRISDSIISYRLQILKRNNIS